MTYIKNINEGNIHDAIDYYLIPEKDYVATYKKISENLEDSYKDFLLAYRIPLFLYHIMSDKVDIDNFNKVIKYIYANTKDEKELTQAFHHFFYETPDAADGMNPHGSLKSLVKRYLKANKHNKSSNGKWKEDHNNWRGISYFFYAIENNKLVFNKEKLPYLESLCRLTPFNRAFILCEAGLVQFITSHLENEVNFLDLKTVLEAIQDNDAFAYDIKKNKNFYNYFIEDVTKVCSDISSYSEIPDEEMAGLYRSLSNMFKNFDNIVLDNVFHYSVHSKFSISTDLIEFMPFVGDNQFARRINQVYREGLAKEKISRRKNIKNFSDLDPNIAQLIDSTNKLLEYAFGDRNFNINYNFISPQKSIFENLIYVKLLEISLEQGKNPYINKLIKNYLLKELGNESGEVSNQIDSIYNRKILANYLQYLDTEENLPKKEGLLKKLKI